jgi:hypothetical protein
MDREENLMEYTILGNTGRRVSCIGFGGATAGIHNYLGRFDPGIAEARDGIIAAIRHAYRLGINYFDTAESYGEGASEEIFGEGLEGLPPDGFFLASKMTPCGPDMVRPSLEASLRRLRRDYIDLIQIHGSFYNEQTADNILRPGGMADALERVKEEGLVKYIGFSIEAQNTAMERLIQSRRFDVMQIQYNFIFQHPYDPSFTCGSLYTAKEAGLGIAVMRSMTSGIFQKWIQTVNPENTFDYSPALLQFVLSNPLADVALIGMRSVDEVERNVAICGDESGRIDLNELHRRIL